MPQAAPALFVEPVFQQRVWGGDKLREWYGDLVPDGPIGECWAISGLPGQSARITAGPGAGGTLADAWRVGLVTGTPQADSFPLLAKVLDPTDWLSVQVHPDDAQAQEVEGEPRGKAECWLTLQAGPDAQIILGHDAQTTAELADALASGGLDTRLLRHPVQEGSFHMVPAGVVHAVGPDQLVYEVQQSSDITYRLHDFDRAGLDGAPRELHVDKGATVLAAPFDPGTVRTAAEPQSTAWGQQRQLVAGEHFAVTEYQVRGPAGIGVGSSYALASVVAGAGTLTTSDGEVQIERGTNFVLPAGTAQIQVNGDFTIVVTLPGQQLAG